MSEDNYVIVVEPCDIMKTDRQNSTIKRLPYEDRYGFLQGLVGGLIEHYNLSAELESNNIDCWICDTGKLDGLEPTFNLLDKHGNILDRIVGPVVFTSFDREGHTFGLDVEQQKIVTEWLDSLEISFASNKEMTKLWILRNCPGFVSIYDEYMNGGRSA